MRMRDLIYDVNQQLILFIIEMNIYWSWVL
jgi:hypothetical protein